MPVEPHIPEAELDRLVAREKHAVHATRLRPSRMPVPRRAREAWRATDVGDRDGRGEGSRAAAKPAGRQG